MSQTNAVFEDVAKLFSGTYVDRYQQVFDRTVHMLQALPYEPGEEIRQVFDHCARAYINASTADAIRSNPSYSESADLQADCNVQEYAAKANLLQARRHILSGHFICLEHQIAASMESIRRFAIAQDEKSYQIILPEKQNAEALERQFSKDFAPVLLTRTSEHDVLKRDIEKLELSIIEVSKILAGIIEAELNMRKKLDSRLSD
jgi:hypothetical protein